MATVFAHWVEFSPFEKLQNGHEDSTPDTNDTRAYIHKVVCRKLVKCQFLDGTIPLTRIRPTLMLAQEEVENSAYSYRLSVPEQIQIQMSVNSTLEIDCAVSGTGISKIKTQNCFLGFFLNKFMYSRG